MRLLPREEKFFDMLEQASLNALSSTKALQELVADFSGLEEKERFIENAEREGDIITHEIMDALNKTFITPFDREDIHELASTLDDIVDLMEATVERMLLYKVGAPREDMPNMVDVLVRATEQVTKIMPCLRDLQHTRRTLDHCIEINRLENEGDKALRIALARLFNEGSDPLHVIKWKEIYEYIEMATDKCEDVADIIESVIVKYA